MCHLILTFSFTVTVTWYNSAINKTKKINNKLKNKIFNIQKHNKTEYKYVQSIQDTDIYRFLFYLYIYLCGLLLRTY